MYEGEYTREATSLWDHYKFSVRTKGSDRLDALLQHIIL